METLFTQFQKKPRTLSKEQKARRKELFRGFTNSGSFVKGVKPWNKGKIGLQKHTSKWKKFMSELCKKRGIKPPIMKGKEHPQWKGGITPIHNKIRGSLEYKLWQDSVFIRDDYTCQKCSKHLVHYLLVAHHILNFSTFKELRFAIDNGITLCKSCHKKFHQIYWIKNNTREQLLEFLKKK